MPGALETTQPLSTMDHPYRSIGTTESSARLMLTRTNHTRRDGETELRVDIQSPSPHGHIHHIRSTCRVMNEES